MQIGYLFIILYVILRSFFTPVYKFFTATVHPFMLNLSATLITVLFLLIIGTKFENIKRAFRNRTFVVFLIISIIGGILLDLSVQQLEIKTFQLFTSFIPITVPIISIILIKEKPTKRVWFGIAATVMGSVLFKQVWGGFSLGFGEILLILGIVLFSLGVVNTRKFVKDLGYKEVFFVHSFFGLIIDSILVFSTGTFQIMDASTLMLFLIFVFAIYITTNLLSNLSLREVPAYIFSTATTALVPIGAIILGMLMFGEALNVFEIIGGILMVGGAVIVTMKKSPAPKKQNAKKRK